LRHPVDRDPFDSELIETMSVALDDACATLGLTSTMNAAVALLAVRIIAGARQGLRDAASLKAPALKDLGPATKH
jgi:hypothetical protein